MVLTKSICEGFEKLQVITFETRNITLWKKYGMLLQTIAFSHLILTLFCNLHPPTPGFASVT